MHWNADFRHRSHGLIQHLIRVRHLLADLLENRALFRREAGVLMRGRVRFFARGGGLLDGGGLQSSLFERMTGGAQFLRIGRDAVAP